MRFFTTILISLLLQQIESYAQTTFSHAEYDGIIVGDVVSGREKSATSGKLINSYVLGQQVKIVGETHWKDIIKGDDTGMCEEYGYSWLEVENLKKERSWMYGKYLFQKNQPHQNEMAGKVIRYKNQDWYFGLAYSLSVGSSNADGLTGCDELELPYLYRESEEKIYPIIIEEDFDLGGPNHIKSMFDGNLLMLASGEGGRAIVADVSIEDEIFISIFIENGFQDGSNLSIVVIRLDGDRFVVTHVMNTGE